MDYIKYYNQKLKKYISGPEAVDWGSKESQEIRFKVLSEIASLHGKTILDVGSGLGDFYDYLNTKLYEVKKEKILDYKGIDINPNMIEKATKKYKNVTFSTEKINEFQNNSFDYVMASGIFHLKISNWKKTTHSTLKEMFRVSINGIAVNFISSLAPQKQNPETQYVNPTGVLNWVLENISKKVILRTDYKNNDFTLYIYT